MLLKGSTTWESSLKKEGRRRRRRKGRKLAKCALALVGPRRMKRSTEKPPRVSYKPELQDNIEGKLLKEWQGSNMRKLSPINNDRQASAQATSSRSLQAFTYLAGGVPLILLLTHLHWS
jgi:hypothetical protein